MKTRAFLPVNGGAPLIQCAHDGQTRVLTITEARELLAGHTDAAGRPVHTALQDAVLDAERMVATR